MKNGGLRSDIETAVEAMREEIIADVCALIEIKSVYGDKEGNTRALDFVLRRAEEFGMRTAKTREGDAGIAEIGAGAGLVGVLAHVDVVDAGDLEKWTSPPYKAAVRGGFIYGRGAEDDKGPVILSLYAFKALLQLKVPLKKRLWLIVGTCEEGVWTDIAHYKMQFPQPDYGFSPDAAYPIFSAEKGYCDVMLTFSGDAAGLDSLDAGFSPNTIPSLATIRRRGQKAVCYSGTAAHSSAPQLADNAITKLCRDGPNTENYGFARFVSRFFAGQEDPACVLGLGGEEGAAGDARDKTTAAPTVLKLTPQGVTLNINIRQYYGVTRAHIQEAFGKYAEEYGYTVSITDILDPMRVDEKQQPFQLMDQVQRAYGLPGGFKCAAGTTYAKSMENFVSWGPITVGEGQDDGSAHQENERFSIETMILSAKMYAEWLARTAEE